MENVERVEREKIGGKKVEKRKETVGGVLPRRILARRKQLSL